MEIVYTIEKSVSAAMVVATNTHEQIQIQIQSKYRKMRTFGTKISNMLRKQQKITANAINTNDASCCEAITIATGAVIKHNTTTLYILMPT